MQKYSNWLLDNAGNVITNATVSVYDAGTQNLSTIYSDPSLTPKANPFSAGTDGYVFFYAANGYYDLSISSATFQFTGSEINSLILFDPQSAQNYLNVTTIGVNNASPQRPIDVTQTAAGVPQIRLTGSVQGHTDLRCGGSGSDDGDYFMQPTGSTVWIQSITTPYPATLKLVAHGAPQANNAVNLELYNTDSLADGTNYERIAIHGKGTADSAHLISSEAGGTGTVRDIHINCAGVNGIYLQPSGKNGIGTTTPRAPLDIVSNAGTQLRLSFLDNTKYANFTVDTNHHLTITPSSTGNIVLNPGTGNIVLNPGGDIQWGKALVALGGGVVSTPGTVGGSGPVQAAQDSWMRVLDSTGATCWVPVWK